MKISVHVFSNKCLRFFDSTDSAVGITAQDYKEREIIWPCHATLYSKKKKEKLAKENSVLISSAIYFIYTIFLFLFLFFIFHFILIYF